MSTVPTSADPELERMERAADWLIRLSEAPTEEALIGAWLRWCQADPENLPAFRRAQAVWLSASSQQGAPTQPSRLEPAGALRVRTLSRTIARWAAAAMMGGIIAGAIWLLTFHSGDFGEQTYRTPVASLGSGTLPDGSQVDLGAHSKIAIHYTTRERRIRIDSGEAFFTVTKDLARPFVVDAGGVRVTALGTAFNVRRGEDRVVVGVSEGRVQVANIDSDVKPAETSGDAVGVSAGEQAVVVHASHRVAVASAPERDTGSWRYGVLKYIHEPLGAVATDLNRYSTRRIVVTDATLRQLPFTGTVFSGRIRDALRAFEDVFPLQVIEHDDEIDLAPRVSTAVHGGNAPTTP